MRAARTTRETTPPVTKALVVATLALVVAASCGGKKVGSACKGNESTCIDKKTAIACRSGAFAEVPCKGPAGCSKFEDHANCDTSVGSAGEACLGEDDEYACSLDRKHSFLCKGTKLVAHLECRGPAGCAVNGKALACDTSIADRGDTCKTAAAFACASDGSQLLVCRDGAFTTHRFCRGKKGCVVASDAPVCDETISLAGDPCGVAGQVVCAVDGKTQLVCQGGVYTKSITCKTACVVTGRSGRAIDCQ